MNLPPVFVAHRAIERERRLGVEVLHLLELLVRDARLLLELVDRRLTPDAGDDRLRGARNAVVRVEHVHRDANRAALVGERAADRVTNPPRRVRREAVAARVIEALDRLHEADVALLDQVDQRQAAAVVAPRDRDDEAQVRLDEAVLRVVLADVGRLDLLDVTAVRRRLFDERSRLGLVVFEVTLLHDVARDAIGARHPESITVGETNGTSQARRERRPALLLIGRELDAPLSSGS